MPFLNNIDTFGPEKIMQKAKLCIEHGRSCQKLNFVLNMKERLQQLNMLETNLIAGRMNAS